MTQLWFIVFLMDMEVNLVVWEYFSSTGIHESRIFFMILAAAAKKKSFGVGNHRWSFKKVKSIKKGIKPGLCSLDQDREQERTHKTSVGKKELEKKPPDLLGFFSPLKIWSFSYNHCF